MGRGRGSSKTHFLYVKQILSLLSEKGVMIKDLYDFISFFCWSLWNADLLVLFLPDVFPDNTCGLPVSTRHTNASQLFIFKYEGREIPEDCQTVGLHSSDASLNHYVLCVTAASFIDPNCSVTVQFTFSNNVMVLFTLGLKISKISRPT